MADELKTIDVTDLQSLPDTAITADHQVVIFTQDGDTDRATVANLVKAANTQNECICIHQASLTIASADVLQLNSVPLTIVAAQGAGTKIAVVAAGNDIDFNTTPYATNIDIELITDGADVAQAKAIGALAASVSRSSNFAISPQPTAAQTVIIENADLKVSVNGGNPTAGDSDITINALYRIINT